MYCVNCGNKVPDDEDLCVNCGKILIPKDMQLFKKGLTFRNDKPREVPTNHMIIAFLFPPVGLIMGIIFSAQDRTGSALLIVCSILSQILWYMIWLMYLAKALANLSVKLMMH
jgi:uncharacterized membrane protein YvbJ